MQKILYITLAFILCFTCVMPVSYADTVYPSLDTINAFSDYEEYVIFAEYIDGQPVFYHINLFDDNKDYITSKNAKFEIKINTSNVPVVYLRDSNGTALNFTRKNYVYQVLNPSLGWTLRDDSTTVQSAMLKDINNNTYSYVSSTVDILNQDGTIFFPPPPTELYQIIQGVTNQTLPQTQTTVVGTMRILVLCGVGCLALLMVFPLFGKVLKRYLPR